jgi:hypothetical protein
MASVSQPPLFTFEKHCSGCKQIKPSSAFSPQKQAASNLASLCRECQRAYQRQRYAANPAVREDMRFRHKLSHYGLTREQYEEMIAQQGGVCALCHQLPTAGRGFHVDHDHTTGKVRALLCNGCNIGIGALREDADLLEAAAAYLRKHRG